jgi:hypothetical protein
VTTTPVTVWHVVDGQLERPGRTGGGVLTVPTQPVAVTTSGLTSSSVTLSWQPPVTNGGSAVTGYVVARDGAGGTSTTVGAGTLTQQFRGLTASTTYHLTVAAINAVGTGPTATKTITTPAVPGPSAARFPGDPNPKANNGTLYWGAGLAGNADTGTLEAGTGAVVGTIHGYWDAAKVPNALSVPNGPMAQFVVNAHGRDRLPLVTLHYPGSNWAGNANGAIDAQLDAWIAWCEAQAKPIYWVVNHEPENGDGLAPDFRAWQQHIRARITVYENAHGPLQRLTFCGCLMSYTFQPANGGPAAWWPGDGVWDVLGIDHYVDLNSIPTPPSTTILGPLWQKVVAFAVAHNAPIFVMEWGVRPSNPNGAQIMQDYYDYCTSGTADVVGLCYFSGGGGWWTLTDNNGMLSKFRALLSASKSIHMSDLGF